MWRSAARSPTSPSRRRRSSPGSTTSGSGGTAHTASSTTARASPRSTSYSRGLVMKLDETARTATFVAEFLHPHKLSAPDTGQFRELVDGGSFIGWGQMPYFTEHDVDGTVRLRRSPAAGQPVLPRIQGRVGGSAARPAGPGPARRERQRDRQRQLERRHQGHAGGGPARHPARRAGRARSRADRTGFETTLTIQGTPEYVVAEALDATGKVLGTSSAIPVRV